MANHKFTTVGRFKARLQETDVPRRDQMVQDFITTLDGVSRPGEHTAKSTKAALAGFRDRAKDKYSWTRKTDDGTLTKEKGSLSKISTQQRAVLHEYVAAAAAAHDKHYRETGQGMSGPQFIAIAAKQLPAINPGSLQNQLKRGPLIEAPPPEFKDPSNDERIDELIRLTRNNQPSQAAAVQSREDDSAPAPTVAASKATDILESWGMSRTAADRLAKQGFDPTDTGKVVDAAAYNISTPTINRLKAQGFRVKNLPGQRTQKAGYSKQELRTGRPAAESNADVRGGLFLRRTIYEDDGSGGVVARTVDPRFSAKNVKAGIKRNTTGKVKGKVRRRQAKAEDKRLNNPLHRAQRIEEIEARRDIKILEAKIQDAYGLRRSALRTQLKVKKFALVNRGLATFIIGIALLFVPWIGVFTWTGWGIGSLALTAIEYAALVIVNVYNLIANGIVSFLALIGNFVSGGLEALSRGWLSSIGLDADVCNAGSECSSRLSSYTPIQWSQPTDLFPEVPKPNGFDQRTVIDLVLGLFGIKFGIFNQLASWFRGGS